jgi:hypothetical protein
MIFLRQQENAAGDPERIYSGGGCLFNANNDSSYWTHFF